MGWRMLLDGLRCFWTALGGIVGFVTTTALAAAAIWDEAKASVAEQWVEIAALFAMPSPYVVPVDALAAGHLHYAVGHEEKTAIVDARTGQEVAWFPEPFATTHRTFASCPARGLWGGARNNRFYMLSLEGDRDARLAQANPRDWRS